MKIGIDVFGYNHATSGIGSYIINFIANLPSATDYEIELFGQEKDRYTYISNNGVPYVSVPVSDNLLLQRIWHKRKINKFISHQNYDVVLFPACEDVIPKNCKQKNIIVVNSVISNFIKDESRKYIRQLKKGLQHASKIVASSEYIKQDLVKLGISNKKIMIIHNGLDHKLFFPIVNFNEDIIQINPFAIKRPYFLYATRLSGEDKKHEQVIKAFEIFKKNTNLPYRLVIAGDFSNSKYSEMIQNCAYNSEFSSDIFLLGHFPHESLPKLYAGADACIFPASQEGVGLPIIEAMACGVPVLCSNSGALREVGRDAPKYFDSDDYEEIASLMQDVVENPKLRERMIEKGIRCSSGYDWITTVQKTLDLAKNI